MAEMIERVAKALEDHVWYDDEGSETMVLRSLKHHAAEAARAAIAAMREPTPAMMKAALGRTVNRGWEAAIDAALAPKGETP